MSTENTNTGIRWSFTKQLDDLDFTDDISLLSHRQQDEQQKLNWLSEEAKKVGLKINTKKTKTMRINHKQQDQIQLQCHENYTYEEFVIVTEAPQCNRMTATGQDTDNKRIIYKYTNRQCTK